MGQLTSVPENVTPEMEKAILLLNNALPKFSSSLIPTQEFTRFGTESIGLITEHLQRNRKDIDRVITWGSMGNKLNDQPFRPDLDIAVFLNVKLTDLEKSPGAPFSKILTDFVKILKDKKYVRIIQTTATFISLEVKGYKIDLYPAINLRNCIPVTSSLWSLNQVKMQQNEILQAIHCLRNPREEAHFLAPGLSEAALAFVKHQPDFTQSVIRLAKLWNSKLNLDTYYVTGRSYLMECVAIQVASCVQNSNTVVAMHKFLEAMTHFSSIYITFDPQLAGVSVDKFYSLVKDLKAPVVIDPVNPYNNLARLQPNEEDRDAIICIFEKTAKNCLTKLKTFKNEQGVEDGSYEFVEKLFSCSPEELAATSLEEPPLIQTILNNLQNLAVQHLPPKESSVVITNVESETAFDYDEPACT